MASLEVLHETFSLLLYPFGERYRQAEAQLAGFESQPGFITNLLTLVTDDSLDLGVRRLAAVYLKNKVNRSWSPQTADVVNDVDKYNFKSNLVGAIVASHASLKDFLVVSLTKVIEIDFQEDKWPELIPEIKKLLQNTNDLAGLVGGLVMLKQVCKFYRWNLMKVNKQLDPLMADVYPHILSIAEASVTAIESATNEEEIPRYYELIYEVLKIYKLSTKRFLPEVIRDQSIAKRTIAMFLRVFMLPMPNSVLSTEPAAERNAQLPVKCQKWASGNIVRTYKNFLTKSYSQLSENAGAYAPYRQLFHSMFAPEITKLFMQKLNDWSEGKVWLSDSVLYNTVTFMDEMIDLKPIFSNVIEPELHGFVSRVLFKLLCPTDYDFDLFEDDATEFIQRQVDIYEMISPPHVAAAFIQHIVMKRKTTLNVVLEFFQELANKLEVTSNVNKERVGLFKLLQALSPVFLAKGSAYRSSLEVILTRFVVPDLGSQHPYLRYEACNTINKFSSFKLESRDTLQKIFQGVLNCFFDQSSLPVQVAAAPTLQSLASNEHNQDVREALRQHITDVIRNLLMISHRIDLESLLNVLDQFVGQFPDQITPFAVDLASQLCQQFISVASELAEAQRQINEAGGSGGAISDSELMMFSNEKTNAGFGIMNSLANLQNNLEHQRELTAKLDEVIAPVFVAVYQNALVDFYPDCLSLHENTLFTLKSVPLHHWQYFEMLLTILKRSKFDYFEDAMPVLENYILYGSRFLAENAAVLSTFTNLLVSFYAPEKSDAIDDASVMFTNARTRAHVMSVVTKLVVSSSLFDGPLLPYLETITETVVARVSADSNNRSASFPPRYNVATVSVVLGALYHNPGTTLTVLRRNKACESFFETWFQTLPEFTRVNDLKLCVMAVLSLLSYYLTSRDSIIETTLPNLIKSLIHSLGALPGAASRVAELMRDEDANYWDADIDEFDDNFVEENESNDEIGENDGSAEFTDQMPDSSVVGAGNGVFMYERPGDQVGESDDDAAKAQIRSQLISQMGFVADDFDEDMYSVSPLDNLNPYDALRAVLSGVQSSDGSFYQKMMSTFTESDKAILQESLQRTSLPKYSPALQ